VLLFDLSEASKSKSLTKLKDKPQLHNGHIFKIHTYLTPTWCLHCHDFIWGFVKQGWKCQKCDYDCHSKCLQLVETKCVALAGGQLGFVENQEEVQLDVESTNQVQERRKGRQTKQLKFNKGSRFRVKPQNAFMMGLVGGSLLFAVPKAANPEDLVVDEKKGKTKDGTLSEISESTESEPVTPLNKDKDLLDAIERDEPLDQTFQSGVNIRKKGERADSEEILEEEFADMANFEDFEIDHDRVLGSGQFGVVKYAIHKPTKTPLAVKVIDKKKFWGKKNSQKHLKREIAILSSIRHPNIIRLQAVFEHTNELYLFMEYIQSGDLLSYVEQKGCVKEDEAKFLFHQFCVGVKYLHDAGVIHRDLKPENLLLSEEDGVKRIKIADFGFANLIGDRSFLQSVVGTPAYVAPEILNKKGYQKSADMWSIGVILYACLSGVFPFDEEEPVEQQIRAGKFNFPDEYWGNVSDEAIDLCCKLLVVNPNERLTIDQVLSHPWFKIQKPLRL